MEHGHCKLLTRFGCIWQRLRILTWTNTRYPPPTAPPANSSEDLSMRSKPRGCMGEVKPVLITHKIHIHLQFEVKTLLGRDRFGGDAVSDESAVLQEDSDLHFEFFKFLVRFGNLALQPAFPTFLVPGPRCALQRRLQ